MLILDWMQSKVISIPPTATLLQCRKLFKEHKINRLPVVDANNIVVGLISSSDVRSFAPSKSTGLEIIELLEIMSETKVRDVMVVDPVTITFKSTIEQAAKKMIDRHVACLPVVNDEEKLVGIITGWDVFKALLDISGAEQAGVEEGFLEVAGAFADDVLVDLLDTVWCGQVRGRVRAPVHGQRQGGCRGSLKPGRWGLSHGNAHCVFREGWAW